MKRNTPMLALVEVSKITDLSSIKVDAKRLQ